MQNQELWPEPHRRNASCSRPRSSSIYKDPPRTRQRTLILAAFLPWGGSDDTVTRRTGHQHTRFSPSRAAAPHQIHKRAHITALPAATPPIHHRLAIHHRLGTGSVTPHIWNHRPESPQSLAHTVRQTPAAALFAITPAARPPQPARYRLSRFDPQPRHRDAHPTLEV